MNQEFSVLMAVYRNDVPEYFKAAVDSVINQTLPPQQVVIVVDGPVSDELKRVIEEVAVTHSVIEIVWLPENVGVGQAVSIGTEHCKYSFIARMDSDDLCVPTRFAKEMEYLAQHPDVDLVGSYGQEFYETIDCLTGVKIVPERHTEIVKFMHNRSPFCQQSVMMKKSALINAGGYRNYFFAEDWDLWIRMSLSDAVFHNLPECLVYMRINRATFQRRHGLKYYQQIKGVLKFMLQRKMINYFQYTKNKLIRFIGHVLVPVDMKKFFYQKFLRGKTKN